jgi:hypothetical protein
MATNLDRFKKDLDRLIELGGQLENAMMKSIFGEEKFAEAVKKQVGKDVTEFLKKIPDFATSYEAWYSESLSLLKQLLPDRVENFISFYEKPKSRKGIKDLSNNNYVIQDFLQGTTITNPYGDTTVEPSAALPKYRQQLSIIKAAKARFESSLFEIRQLVQADLFDSELEAARELLKNKFLRAAGAIAGVVLEKHLHQVCDDHTIAISKKNPGISDLNELLKTNGVIEIPQWRHITLLADIRNLCDHNKKKEPTTDQIEDLIAGADKVLKTIF